MGAGQAHVGVGCMMSIHKQWEVTKPGPHIALLIALFSMRVLILGLLKSETGNCSTIQRISQGLLQSGHECSLVCAKQCDRSQLHEQIQKLRIQCVLGLHAWRAGALLTDCPVPYVIVFGGTDLNEHSRDDRKLAVMTQAVQQARFLVAFSSPMARQSIVLWPEYEEKIILQPQAVYVSPSTFNLKEKLKSMSEKAMINLDVEVQEMVILLLVAGLRPVKDPLYLADAVSEWHKHDQRVYLVIVGPELDVHYADKVKAQIQRTPGVVLLPAIKSQDLHSAMQASLALVNTSLSEGMAESILEAMALKVPVLVRNIPGNAAIVHHKETGLLFDEPEEFVLLAKELLTLTDLRMRLVKNAKGYVDKHHSILQERDTYSALVSNLNS